MIVRRKPGMRYVSPKLFGSASDWWRRYSRFSIDVDALDDPSADVRSTWASMYTCARCGEPRWLN